MKIIRKIILFIAIVMVLTTSIFAVDISKNSENAVEHRAYESVARVEEYEWRFKTIDGVRYKRLWSITYGRWLTDWIPCD